MTSSRPEDLLLGIDAGTSSIRAAVFDRKGQLRTCHAVPTPVIDLDDGGSEHDPAELFDAVAAVVARSMADVGSFGRVRGMAVAAFGETLIGVDRYGRPTTRGLAWYDPRPAAEAARIEATVGRRRIAEITGLRAEPTYGLAKIAWMQARQLSADLWLSVADWLAFGLSGVMATDPTMAGRTMGFDLASQCWSPIMLAAVGLSPSAMPAVQPCGMPLGRILPEVAGRLGLPADCIVGVGGYDRVLGALAAGAGAPGTVLDSLGTAEGMLAFLSPMPSPADSAALGFNQGILPMGGTRRPFLFGGLPTCGAAVNWLGEFLGMRDEQALSALAQEAAADPAGPVFLPTLRLASAPDPEQIARGAFLGIGTGTSRAQLARAVFEGLAMEAARVLELMSGPAGSAGIQRILAVGGGTRNSFLLRLKASCFGRTIELPVIEESSALGAAMCAAVACGLFPDLADAALGMGAHPIHEVEPCPHLITFYRRRMDDLHGPLTARLVKEINPLLLGLDPPQRMV